MKKLNFVALIFTLLFFQTQLIHAEENSFPIQNKDSEALFKNIINGSLNSTFEKNEEKFMPFGNGPYRSKHTHIIAKTNVTLVCEHRSFEGFHLTDPFLDDGSYNYHTCKIVPIESGSNE